MHASNPSRWCIVHRSALLVLLALLCLLASGDRASAQSSAYLPPQWTGSFTLRRTSGQTQYLVTWQGTVTVYNAAAGEYRTPGSPGMQVTVNQPNPNLNYQPGGEFAPNDVVDFTFAPGTTTEGTARLYFGAGLLLTVHLDDGGQETYSERVNFSPGSAADVQVHRDGALLVADFGPKEVGSFGTSDVLTFHFQAVAPPQPRAEIHGDGVIRDNPDQPTTQGFEGSDPFLIHGGSFASTADSLKLHCEIRDAVPGVSPTRYTWSVDGDTGHFFPAPKPLPASNPKARFWDLGGKWVPARPEELTVHCKVELSNGKQLTADQKVKVGVRTNDVVVIGRINPAGVPLSRARVGGDLLRVFPSDHKYDSLADQADAAGYLAQLQGDGALHRPDNTGMITDVEAQYILNWLFRSAANTGPPPGSFRSSAEAESYRTNNATDYKLFNRAQIDYHLENGQMVVDRTIHNEVSIGITLDPITRSVPDPGIAGPNNGKVENGSASWSQINDGTPDFKAVLVFNNLMKAHGVTWNHIGSKITFSPDLGTGFDLDAQFYPTYTIYTSSAKGLRQLANLVQAPRPADNFTNPSYPSQSSDTSLLLRRHFHYFYR